MGNNIFKPHIQKKINIKICKELIQLNGIKKKSNLKMGIGSEQTFLKRKHTDDQYLYEKMHNINNHQENVNQNHNEFPLHIH